MVKEGDATAQPVFSKGKHQKKCGQQVKPYKPSPTDVAPEVTTDSDTEGVWFTDASSQRLGSQRRCKAEALEIAVGKTVTKEGSAQVGELCACTLAVENGAEDVYTDSYATFKGATEWICQWEGNQWEIGHTKVWRAEDQQRLLEIGWSRPIKMRWVKGHSKKETPVAKWSQQVDYLA
ncbi:ribonuclease H-like [Dryobates pubescens]|uniref:ribonuclease H-like n=1 Tax=Dryobates pubescens TaxID=118200 RepID=UPI0023B8E621|nr:ribonuclease H-like [Dryobates pubescens]